MTQIAPRPGNVPALHANYLHGLASGHKLHPFRQPANYLHGLARRLRKPFPFRQPANYFTDSPEDLTGTRADWRALLKFSTQIYLGDFPVPASQLPSRTRQTTHEALLSQTASQLRSRTRQTTPPLRQPALTGPVHAFSVHFSAPPNTFNIFILRQKCSRIALVRFRLERLQKLTFYNQTNEEN